MRSLIDLDDRFSGTRSKNDRFRCVLDMLDGLEVSRQAHSVQNRGALRLAQHAGLAPVEVCPAADGVDFQTSDLLPRYGALLSVQLGNGGARQAVRHRSSGEGVYSIQRR